MEPSGKVFWAKRCGHDAWQFPQGGIQHNETPEEALYRELAEEIGLQPDDVTLLAATTGWLRYRLPGRYLRHSSTDKFVGQKQKWFLLLGESVENKVKFDTTGSPEFEDWRWVAYRYPIDHVVDFKKQVYEEAIEALAPFRRSFLDQVSGSGD